MAAGRFSGVESRIIHRQQMADSENFDSRRSSFVDDNVRFAAEDRATICTAMLQRQPVTAFLSLDCFWG